MLEAFEVYEVFKHEEGEERVEEYGTSKPRETWTHRWRGLCRDHRGHMPTFSRRHTFEYICSAKEKKSIYSRNNMFWNIKPINLEISYSVTRLKSIQSPSDSKSFWKFPTVIDSSRQFWKFPTVFNSSGQFPTVTDSYWQFAAIRDNRQPEISLFTLLHGQNSSSPCTAISAMLDP